MSRSAPTLATGLFCLGLLGCALASGSRPPTTYDLVAPRSFAGAAKPAPWQLLVYEPTAVTALDTDPPHGAPEGRSGLLLQGHCLERPAAAPRPDAHDRDLPEFRRRQVGERIERAIRAGHRVARLPDRCFGRTRPRAEIDIFAKLINTSTGRVVATKGFSARVPAASDAPGRCHRRAEPGLHRGVAGHHLLGRHPPRLAELLD